MFRLDFVIDAACVGLEDPIKGHLPVGFIVIDKSKSSAHISPHMYAHGPFLLDISPFNSVLTCEITFCATFFAVRSQSTAVPISRKEAVDQVVKSVREFVGPVAFFKTAVIVPSLPKVGVLSVYTNM